MSTKSAQSLLLVSTVACIAFIVISMIPTFSGSRNSEVSDHFPTQSESLEKIEASLLSVHFAKAADSGMRFLCIAISVSNKTTDDLDYDSWNSCHFGYGATLRNGDGEEYKRMQFGAKTGQAAAIPASIPSNGRLTDELYFEYPDGGTEPIELTLRSKHSKVRIGIPIPTQQSEAGAFSAQ